MCAGECHKELLADLLVATLEEGVRAILAHPDVATAIDARGTTPLHLAAAARRVEVLAHPDVATVRDRYGSTPLHILAATSGCVEVLAHHAAATAIDRFGRTAQDILAGHTKT